MSEVVYINSEGLGAFLFQNLNMSGYNVNMDVIMLVIDIFIDYLTMMCDVVVQDRIH